ncbi:hypothetical protein L0U85_09405 [Glycomyces sp. L485]|uniref:hypothetical protein n=1 Tax=Glycomyces sp. L485 TaxID=2909235 RepID=UPI001F4B3B5C|nr:hypothetical protein [Glycomyces sp. L485]MCH7231066.1 hypothetical protein [Glycomyces sp. L485]
MARQLDSEALRAYRDIVQAQLEKLEEEVVPQLESSGKLGKMPAFGTMDGADAARTNYTAFHEGVWNSLQGLREALNGVINTLNDSGDLSDESDEVAAADMDAVDSNLEGPEPQL